MTKKWTHINYKLKYKKIVGMAINALFAYENIICGGLVGCSYFWDEVSVLLPILNIKWYCSK